MSDFDDRHDDNADSSDEGRRVRQRVEGLFRDVFRKTVSQGAGARQLTEEAVKNIVTEMKLPREVAQFMLAQADNVRTEVVRVVAGEVRRFLDEANLGEELAKILTSLSFEVRTEIRFIPNDEAVRPSVKSRVGIRTRGGETQDLGDEDNNAIDQAIRTGVAGIASRLFDRVVRPVEDDEETAPGARGGAARRAADDVRSRVSEAGRRARDRARSVTSPAGRGAASEPQPTPATPERASGAAGSRTSARPATKTASRATTTSRKAASSAGRKTTATRTTSTRKTAERAARPTAASTAAKPAAAKSAAAGTRTRKPGDDSDD